MNVTVKEVAGKTTVLAGGSGLGREVASPQVCTPELSSPLFWKGMTSSVVHLLPRQMAYLCSLPKRERLRLVRAIVRQKPACIVVSNRTVCKELLDKAAAAAITVLKTGSVSKMARLIASKLTPQISLHGVLVEIFGLGTLIIGESAIGKSEAALDLVLRGHKLAADDMVILEKTSSEISGHATDMGADLLQIRGLGIINIRALYGESATVNSCRIGLVVELEEWKRGHHYSLIGLRERRYKLLGVNLPYLRLPVKTGRNMATLIEVAARNQMLKNKGIYTAREINRKLRKRLAG
ncbi:MAG TPA: HPr(Ser) kinase/phosphatase [Nitrospirota bacterium]|nr:HPr(Ser) kinase/phosphatase [Nitrospirota bacterium]